MNVAQNKTQLTQTILTVKNFFFLPVSRLNLFAFCFCPPSLRETARFQGGLKAHLECPRAQLLGLSGGGDSTGWNSGLLVFFCTDEPHLQLLGCLQSISTNSLSEFLLQAQQHSRLCWRLWRKFEINPPPKVFITKRRDKKCTHGKIVASQELNNTSQIMYLNCNCGKSTGWKMISGSVMRKGPPEQVESELDSETWARFGQAEKKDTGIPGVNVSAGISTHEGEWLTLGTCLEIHSGRIKLAFYLIRNTETAGGKLWPLYLSTHRHLSSHLLSLHLWP